MGSNKQAADDVIIIGGGLVGSLCACFMAKRGYQVKLYEYRDDIRRMRCSSGRSINLAISHRGREALKALGLEDKVLRASVPMKGRLIHDLSGKTKSLLYDRYSKQCIYSVGRNELNSILLNEAEKYPNVELFFKHKLINADFQGNAVRFLKVDSKEEEMFETKAKLIIGADGAHSMLRRVMQQTLQFQYSQTYIEHGYMEFSISAEKGEEMIKNHLHIWPRAQFMLISLPNNDGTWTVTLFMTFEQFDSLSTSDHVLDFFNSTFPDVVPLIGEKELVKTYFSKKPSHLCSVKCSPYHIGQTFLIIGDAAHAMVPFYGQGMNAGFEDCMLLDKILNQCQDQAGIAIAKFTEQRKEDAHEICDLAMYNYIEMRYLVTKQSFHMRKFVDEFLFWCFPNVWIPLYNSVTFTSLSFALCTKNREWQDKVIQVCTIGILIAIFSFVVFIIFLQ